MAQSLNQDIAPPKPQETSYLSISGKVGKFQSGTKPWSFIPMSMSNNLSKSLGDQYSARLEANVTGREDRVATSEVFTDQRKIPLASKRRLRYHSLKLHKKLVTRSWKLLPLFRPLSKNLSSKAGKTQ